MIKKIVQNKKVVLIYARNEYAPPPPKKNGDVFKERSDYCTIDCTTNVQVHVHTFHRLHLQVNSPGAYHLSQQTVTLVHTLAALLSKLLKRSFILR